MDYIFIEQLRLDMIIGEYDFERTDTQPIFADITLYPQHAIADIQDDLSKTIDYAQVSAGIITLSQTHSPRLLETFADLCAEYVLSNFAIQKIQLRLSKPQAVANASTVGICITRTQQNT